MYISILNSIQHASSDRKSVKLISRKGDLTVFLAVPIRETAKSPVNSICGSCVSSAWMHMQAFFVIELLISIR